MSAVCVMRGDRGTFCQEACLPGYAVVFCEGEVQTRVYTSDDLAVILNKYRGRECALYTGNLSDFGAGALFKSWADIKRHFSSMQTVSPFNIRRAMLPYDIFEVVANEVREYDEGPPRSFFVIRHKYSDEVWNHISDRLMSFRDVFIAVAELCDDPTNTMRAEEGILLIRMLLENFNFAPLE